MQYVTFWCYVLWSVQAIVFEAIRHHAWFIRQYGTYSLIFLMLIYVLFTFVITNWWCVFSVVQYISHFILYYVYRIMCL